LPRALILGSPPASIAALGLFGAVSVVVRVEAEYLIEEGVSVNKGENTDLRSGTVTGQFL
jgi:hypothetical protein